MQRTAFVGNVVLPDRVLNRHAVVTAGGRIEAVIAPGKEDLAEASIVDVGESFICPGFVDIHIHGGGGSDFMDGTDSAFDTVARSHLRHGSTSLVVTTTVATHDQILKTLDLAAARVGRVTAGQARILGTHFYGPYFNLDARGCHPADPVRPPATAEYRQYLEYSESILTATIAPEVEGTQSFAIECRKYGIPMNVGHSHATFEQVEQSLSWGVKHVDHLFCAMSDKSKLRQSQTYPMRGGVLEATLYFDELTTEVIADGKHLARELLRLALKVKGSEKVALVTDCNRALDMPEGEYLFGPLEGGEPFLHRDGVGIMPDLASLASGATGLDHAVRHMVEKVGLPIHEAIRMASLTPATIVGRNQQLGSLQAGKLADLVILGPRLQVEDVYLAAARQSI